MFKKPLVSPDILGASAGASFGACLAMLMNFSNTFIQVFAFAGGMIAVGLVMLVNKVVRGDALLGLILGGILVGTLFSRGTSIIKFVADADDKLPAITFWLKGSFAGAEQSDILPLLIPMGIGFALVLCQAWNLNVMSFGEDEAKSLGLDTTLTRTLVIPDASNIPETCGVAEASHAAGIPFTHAAANDHSDTPPCGIFFHLIHLI